MQAHNSRFSQRSWRFVFWDVMLCFWGYSSPCFVGTMILWDTWEI